LANDVQESVEALQGVGALPVSQDVVGIAMDNDCETFLMVRRPFSVSGIFYFLDPNKVGCPAIVGDLDMLDT